LIIPNERKHALEMLERGLIQPNKMFLDLIILTRYLSLEIEDDRELKNRLESFCEKYVEYYDKHKHSGMLSKCIRIAKKYTLKEIDSINIYKSELKKIDGIKDINQAKICFTMLVLYRINGNFAFEISINELFELANVKLRHESRLDLMYVLTSGGYINSNTKNKRWVEFAEKDISADVCMEIVDFNNFVVEYLRWKGENVTKCDVCGVIVEKKVNNEKYCRECAKEEWKKYNAEKQKEYRNKKCVYSETDQNH